MWICVTLLISINSFAQDKTDKLLTYLESEIKREYEYLADGEQPVYYMDYRVDDVEMTRFDASFGTLNSDYANNSRVLTTSIRVGDSNFDQSHPVNGSNPYVKVRRNLLPVTDDSLAIIQSVWYNTDRAWREAVSAYTTKKNEIKAEEKEAIADFSTEPFSVYFEPDTLPELSHKLGQQWKSGIVEISDAFNKNDSIIQGNITFSFMKSRKYFVSSEGASVVQNSSLARIRIYGVIKTEEGNELPLTKSYEAFSPEGLPNIDAVKQDVAYLVDLLIALNRAPKAEPFSGPALLAPSATGVFFHEIFGHRVEGHRLKNESDGHTFKKMVDERVLPKAFSVVFNPQVKSYKGQDLLGYYMYDDQGVEGQRVDVVKGGMLNTFLMSRRPVDGFSRSNGHGRAQAGASPISRQSNMFVATSKPYTDAELRKKLLKECKKQKKAYGYYFKEVTGGFTQTGRYIPNAFNVMPTLVYRIYVDQRPDELVRGVDLIGTPLSMFSEIRAAGGEMGIFNGYCGAESGQVPVATVAPALFVRKIETQKKPEKTGQFPILQKPISKD